MLIIVLICAIAELLFSVYFKYSTNGLSISNIDVLYIGNVISSIPAFLLILGIALQILLKRQNFQEYKFTFLTFIGVLVFSYILIFMTQDNLFNQTNYIFGFPAVKLLNAVFFTVSKFAVISMMSLVWASLLYDNKLVRIRSFIISLITIALFFVFAFLYNLKYNSEELITEGDNFAIVFGAAVWSGDKPSPMFKARIDKSYDLYRTKKITTIQLTGGNAPGELSEAKTAEKRLLSLGVKPQDLFVEDKTSNTSEQVKYIHQKMLNFDKKYSQLILISDSFHLPRIMTICDFLNISALPSSSEYQLKWEKLLYYRFRESLALLLFWNFGV